MVNVVGLDFIEEENEKFKGVSCMEFFDFILEWGGVEKIVAEK